MSLLKACIFLSSALFWDFCIRLAWIRMELTISSRQSNAVLPIFCAFVQVVTKQPFFNELSKIQWCLCYLRPWWLHQAFFAIWESVCFTANQHDFGMPFGALHKTPRQECHLSFSAIATLSEGKKKKKNIPPIGFFIKRSSAQAFVVIK